MITAQLSVILLFDDRVKFWSFSVETKDTAFPSTVFLNDNSAVPVCVLPDRLLNFAVNNKESPCLTKRGLFNCIINGFCVTASFSEYANLRSGLCANNINFHLVSASGAVKLKETSPLSSVCSCG